MLPRQWDAGRRLLQASWCSMSTAFWAMLGCTASGLAATQLRCSEVVRALCSLLLAVGLWWRRRCCSRAGAHKRRRTGASQHVKCHALPGSFRLPAWKPLTVVPIIAFGIILLLLWWYWRWGDLGLWNVEEIQSAFSSLDTDFDGSLNRHECLRWLSAQFPHSDPRDRKRDCRFIDKNGDKVISFIEFREVLEDM